MNINELFSEYLDALLVESDIEGFSNLVEWLVNSDEDLEVLAESHMNLELPSNPPTAFGIDSKREDTNQGKKSKSESYESVRKKLLAMTGHLDEANEGAVKYLDAVLKAGKAKYGDKNNPKGKASRGSKKSKSKELNDKGPIGKRKKKGGENLKNLLAARRKRKKAPAKKKEPGNKAGGKSGKKTGRKFEPKGSNSAAAKRFISYRSSKEGERKHPAPRAPEQSGRVKGKIDGDLKGRFARYYGEKGEAIRHAVAVKIARGDQNLSGLSKGRGRKGGGGGRKESQTTKNLKADTNDKNKLKTLRRLQATKRRKG